MRRYARQDFLRHRVGSRRMAVARAERSSDYRELVAPAGAIIPDCVTFTNGPLSYVVFETRTVVLDRSLPLFDLAFAYGHELGHLFDHENLGDEDRARFAATLGRSADDWWEAPYEKRPSEAFATAFALLSCPGPWRNRYVSGAYWQPQRRDDVLAMCRAVIVAASGRQGQLSRE